MLRTRKRKFIALFTGALCVIGISAAAAIGAAEDKWSAGANLAWAASSSKTTFTSSVVTVTCTTNTAGGSSVGAGPDVGALTMNAPKFSSCKDNLGGTDTVTTIATGWKVSFVSDLGNTACPTGTGKDETSGSDCVVILVPQKAATIKLSTLGCTLTVQPSGPTNVGATVSDRGGTTKDTFTLTSRPLKFSGCGVVSGSSAFSGTYTLSAPHAGVLVDAS
jgi:hypothetical protein